VPEKNNSPQQDRPIRIGTRESKLALLQTEIVKNSLTRKFADLRIEVVHITTGGDKVQDRPIADLGSQGVFVKELEEALLDNRVDLVVHSLKDLPTQLPAGLVLAAVLDRADARDVLVSNSKLGLHELPAGSKVATSSRRRSAQLKHLRADLVFVDIRGNIPTRLRKHDEGLCDAMVLAAAGLIRLGAQDRITEYLDSETSTPAAGQGALAVECRADDDVVLQLAAAIEEESVRAEITAERTFLERLGGGCSVPIGVVAETVEPGKLQMLGCVASADGKHLIRSRVEGSTKDATKIGIDLANVMLKLGAANLLEHLKNIPVTISPP
jgi:hydroxymethylbilane synthase